MAFVVPILAAALTTSLSLKESSDKKKAAKDERRAVTDQLNAESIASEKNRKRQLGLRARQGAGTGNTLLGGTADQSIKAQGLSLLGG